MRIVVGVLGVIIIALAVAFFTISPQKSPNPIGSDIVRSEEPDPVVPNTYSIEANLPPQEITTDDETAIVALNTLTGTAKYSTPDRVIHNIAVTLTLDGELVTDAELDFENGKGPSNENQKRFQAAYRTEVIGKKMTEVSLSRVGGSSLTSKAFNEAVAAIKSQVI